MEAGTTLRRREIEEIVIGILRTADLETATEYSVRTTAAARLGIDLSDLDHKVLVRTIVESFLLSATTAALAPLEDEVDNDKVHEETNEVGRQQEDVVPHSADYKECRGDSGRIICKLSSKRSVSIHDFGGKNVVSIRDYYRKDGKQYPSARGISLTAKQWSTFKSNVPGIEETILQMESRIRSRRQIEPDMSIPVTAEAPEGHVHIDNKVEEGMCNSPSVLAAQGENAVERRPVETNMCGLMYNFSPREHDKHNPVTALCPQRIVPIGTIRLDGKNYHCWMHQMDFFLKQLEVAYVLFEPCPSISLGSEATLEEIAQAKAAAQKWVDDDYICHHNILNSLSDHLFYQYSKKTCCAKELWDELKLVYDEDFGTKRSQVNKYVQFQMVDGVSIIEQVEELHKIADSIIASGMWIDESFHVSVIISKLPPSWKDYRAKLMREEFLPLNVLMYRLRFEEEERYCHKKVKHSKNSHEVRSKPLNKENKKICYICGKIGHISKQCKLRKESVEEKINEKNVEFAPAVTDFCVADETMG